MSDPTQQRLSARDLMTSGVVTLDEAASIGEAMVLLVEHGVRHLPITREGEAIGMISDRDLRRFEGLLAAEVSDPEQDEARLAMPVSALLEEAPLVSIAASGSAADVVTLMLEQKVGAVLVVEGDELVGIVTTIDILRAARDRL